MKLTFFLNYIESNITLIHVSESSYWVLLDRLGVENQLILDT